MSGIVSHRIGGEVDVRAVIAQARARIAEADERFGSPEQLLEDLDMFSQCEFGQWMLVNGGWNAYWTRYVMDYVAPVDANPVELFFMTQAVGVLATRERAAIFNKVIDSVLQPGAVAMSVGCGYMDELLRVPQATSAGRLVGVDLDPQALSGAQVNAQQHGLAAVSILAEGDAWDLAAARVAHGSQSEYDRLISGGVDVLTSNGLNIYVSEDDETTDLYRSFRGAMRSGGTLVVSAVTPPGEWDFTGISQEATRRLRGLMLMCDVKWAHYRTEDTTRGQLVEAGFELVEVIRDSRRSYPTFVAVAQT